MQIPALVPPGRGKLGILDRPLVRRCDALISTVGRQLLSATVPERVFDPLQPSLAIARGAE